MKRFLITALLLITFIGNVLADDVTFVASAPKSVVVNQHFKLSYTINTTDAKEPVIQDFKGFEVLSAQNLKYYKTKFFSCQTLKQLPPTNSLIRELLGISLSGAARK